MKKNIYKVLIIMLVLAIGFITGISYKAFTNDKGFIPVLRVSGDVATVVELNGNPESYEKQKQQIKSEQIEGISLSAIIESAEPAVSTFDVLLIGYDGVSSKIDGATVKDCYIYFSKAFGWSFSTQNHPINSTIKNINEIVVVAKENTPSYGINIITADKNLSNITPGQIYLRTQTIMPYHDGKTSKIVDGEEYNADSYKYKKLLPIKSLFDFPTDNLLIMGAEGDYEYINTESFFEVVGNKVNYVDIEKRKFIQNVKGIIADYPKDSIMNAYYDSLYYLENNEKVLVIYMDGFSYQQYEYCMNNGYMPFIGSMKNAKRASGVYKPVTNAGFAAMITGQPPRINGIIDRDGKDLKVSSIFNKAINMGKKSVLVEGDIKILNTEIEPILNIDKNSNGLKDDEILSTALNQMKNDPDFIIVHFHSIDEAGHSYGDLDSRTIDTINNIDKYVEQISASWSGRIIITSDHGMHKTSDGGSHGEFRYEDLIVPYIIK